jgi:hypothetical protein
MNKLNYIKANLNLNTTIDVLCALLNELTSDANKLEKDYSRKDERVLSVKFKSYIRSIDAMFKACDKLTELQYVEDLHRVANSENHNLYTSFNDWFYGI